MAHVQKTPPPISLLRTDLPPELTAIVQRMMAKEPDQRFATPAEVAAVLAPLAAGADLPALLAEATELLTPTRSGELRTTTTGSLSASPHGDTGVGRLTWPGLSETRFESRRDSSTCSSCHRVGGTGRADPAGGDITARQDSLGDHHPGGGSTDLAGAVVEVDGQQRVTIDPGQGLEKVTVAADEKEHVLRVTKGGFENLHPQIHLEGGRQTDDDRASGAACCPRAGSPEESHRGARPPQGEIQEPRRARSA